MSTTYLRSTYNFAKLYLTSTHKKKAWGLLAAIITLNLLQIYLLVRLNMWNNTFYSALQEYRTDAIFSALGEFSILAGLNILVAVYAFYLQQVFEVNWRVYLTKVFMNNWLAKRAYYMLQLTGSDTDNPDQRISEDVKMFANITLKLVVGLLRAVAIFIAFVAILWQLSGSIQIPFINIQVEGYLVYFAIIYACLGSLFTHVVGKRLISLNFTQQKHEANFRFALVRLRENSENIAFYRGEELEGRNFTNYFKHVIDNFWHIIHKQKQLTWLINIYMQIAIIFPFVVAMPKYLSRTINLGGLMQISSAFGRVQDSLSCFIEAYTTIAEWQAVVARLHGFDEHIKSMHALNSTRITYEQNSNDCLHVDNLTIELPNSKVLLANLSLTIYKGEHLLIKGSSGSGKSTFLRTLAGLWLFGEGKIHVATPDNVLFLPQRTYLPLGSLRQAILYPNTQDVPDSLVKLSLQSCSLEYLIEQLDTSADWSRILSLGEQQRIAIARVLLLKPQWLFLDEATSALDANLEQQVYKAILQQIPDITLISVAHKPNIAAFHKKSLTLLPNAAWQVSELE